MAVDKRLVILTVAAYVTVLFVAQAIGMPSIGAFTPPTAADNPVITRRIIATVIAVVAAGAAAGTFGYFNRRSLKKLDTLAVMALILFGGMYAVYMVVPKNTTRWILLPDAPTVSLVSHLLASFAAAGVFGAGQLRAL
jgi:hypothetical protein